MCKILELVLVKVDAKGREGRIVLQLSMQELLTRYERTDH